MDSLTHIKESAALWVARRHGSLWTQADEAAFEGWINTSIRHRVEYLSLENRWREADRLKIIAPGLRAAEGEAASRWDASPYFSHLRRTEEAQPVASGSGELHRKRGRPVIFAAAAMVTAAAVGIAWHLARDVKAYSTPVGVTAVVPLPDGSKITLNTDSKVSVSVNGRERRVTLKQGEAFFEVTDDPRHPFLVQAGGQRIVVLGTKFSVWRNGADVRVIVTEGKVRVNDRTLSAGDVVQARDEKVAVREHSLPRAQELLSWRYGYLDLDEMPLAEVVAEFNRHNTRQFVIQDAAIGEIRVSGHFRPTSMEAFARLLEKRSPVSVTMTNEAIVLGAR